MNLIKMQIPLCISKALAISVSLATIGVCVFSASASVDALFYFYGKRVRIVLGYVILLVVSVGFLVLVFQGVKSFNKGQETLQNRIENDPAYIVEKRVKARLKNIRWGKAGSFRSCYRDIRNNESIARQKRYLEENRKVCADFLDDGAIMVCAHNTTDPDPQFHNFNLGQGLYIYTPNAVFRKVKDFQSGAEIEAILSPGMGFGIKGELIAECVTVDNKKSVAKSAAIGGIIGGAAGAVVGAAYAAEKNNAGPTTKAVAGGMIYSLQLFTEWIDTVFISKRVSQFCPPPPKEFIQHETETYWILNIPAITRSKETLQEPLDYLNRIVGHLAATAIKTK